VYFLFTRVAFEFAKIIKSATLVIMLQNINILKNFSKGGELC